MKYLKFKYMMHYNLSNSDACDVPDTNEKKMKISKILATSGIIKFTFI